MAENRAVITLEALVADADGARGAVPVPAAELGAGLADVHVVDGPALLFRLFTLLDPSELCGTGGDVVGQLDGDPLPARAVDGIVDGGFMELEWGAADAVRGGRQALGLDELPGIRPCILSVFQQDGMEVAAGSGFTAHHDFELHHVSWLNNEFPGGESVVSLVFLFVWPVEVEGWIAAESCRPDCVGVEAPVLFVGGTFIIKSVHQLTGVDFCSTNQNVV